MKNLCIKNTASISPDVSLENIKKKLSKGDVGTSVGNVSEGVKIRADSALNRVEKMTQKPPKIAGNFDLNIEDKQV